MRNDCYTDQCLEEATTRYHIEKRKIKKTNGQKSKNDITQRLLNLKML